jgi:diguanylate cyclase (GGDEF)-like protein
MDRQRKPASAPLHVREPGDAQGASMHAAGPSKSRVASWLFLVCAVVVAAPVALPGSAESNSAGLVATAAGLLVMSGIVALFGRRMRDSLYPVFTLAGCGAIAAAVYFYGSDRSPSHDEMLFLLLSLFAGYFYGRRMVAVHILVIAVAYGAALGLTDPGPGEGANWLLSVATFGAAAALLSRMKERVDALIERLADVARTDYLTGLLNRRGFMERIEYELELARRSGRPLSLLVGDLDRFKELNDRYGHPAGDDVLAKVGETLDTTRRRIDTAARMGGEEFALIAPFTDAKGAFAVAERVRGELAELFGTAHDGKPARRGALPVSISFGIVTYPTHGQTVEALLHAADRAMYEAKRRGRNRAVVYKANTVPEYAGPPVAPVPEQG